MTRRLAAMLGALAIATVAMLPFPSMAQEPEWRHGAALFGELRYGPGFPRYDHVNPDAPSGGTLNQAALGGFDSFNPFVVQGRPAAGITYSGGLLWDTLFEQAVDQPSAAYGLIADAFRHPADYSSATYRLNPAARFHDGAPVTPEDVIWTLGKLKEIHPLYREYYRNVVGAEKTGDHEVTFRFDITGNRELPLILGDLPVLPKHWWEGTKADGTKRDISQPSDEPPLGSGPYRIADFKMGESITWERVADHWARDLNVRVGRYNFERIHYTYFGDENALWEAFKKGGIADTRTEYISRRWATEYDFPAFGRGDVVRKAFPSSAPEPFQAYFLNTRNPKLKDIRVRKALTLLFDFETMNKNLFFGSYARTDSFFEGGELQAPPGVPEGREREILEEYRGRIDEAILDKPFALPVHSDANATRQYQREALGLFREAGYTFRGGKMLDPAGQPFTLEILGSGPTDERVGLPTVDAFRKLGIETTIRIVDDAQYKARMDGFEFEMTMASTAQSLSPGNEQREYWTGASAARPGTRNYSGISDPVVDELVERIINAADRAELIALTHALDRILMRGHYAIPMWHNPETWFAWWRKIVFPEPQPPYASLDLHSGWIDTEVEKELAR